MDKDSILLRMNWRYAVKVFDPTKKISDEDLTCVLEAGRLSPSAYGLEPWHFFVIENKNIRASLRTVSYDQSKVTDASHLIVIAYRTDGHTVADELLERTAITQGKTKEELQGFSDMVHGAITRLGDNNIPAWYRAQTYIPLGIMLETAALLGVDACPMEGFVAEEVDTLLDLPEKNLKSTAMIALGYRGEDPYSSLPKTRRQKDDVITTLI